MKSFSTFIKESTENLSSPLLKQFPYLTVLTSRLPKNISANIRAYIKKNYPKAKITSLRTDGTSAITIKFSGELDKKDLVEKFQYHKSSSQFDKFRDLFGAFDYVFVEQEYTDKDYEKAFNDIKTRVEKHNKYSLTLNGSELNFDKATYNDVKNNIDKIVLHVDADSYKLNIALHNQLRTGSYFKGL